MTVNRLIDIANLRQEIAIAAARMIAEEGTSYEVAKRKAAVRYWETAALREKFCRTICRSKKKSNCITNFSYRLSTGTIVALTHTFTEINAGA